MFDYIHDEKVIFNISLQQKKHLLYNRFNKLVLIGGYQLL